MGCNVVKNKIDDGLGSIPYLVRDIILSIEHYKKTGEIIGTNPNLWWIIRQKEVKIWNKNYNKKDPILRCLIKVLQHATDYPTNDGLYVIDETTFEVLIKYIISKL